MKKFCLGLITLLFLLICTGFLYQFISTRLDEKRYPPIGQMVDIGGYRLHMQCMGSGGPTVILEAGMGCDCLEWALVQPEIAKFTRVCSYDRAGYGWSDPSPLERTSQNIVSELHTLLKNGNVQGPYILVGHSFGGLNVRLYANKYPNEVAGVILVDASHEDQFKKLPAWPQSTVQKVLHNQYLAPFFASMGVFRLLNHMPEAEAFLKMLPEDIRQMFNAEQSTTKYIKTVSQEDAKIRISATELKEAGGFLGDKPLIVITAEKEPIAPETGQSQELRTRWREGWNELQKDLVSKSTCGKQIFAEESGHMIPLEQPQIIVQAVEELVAEIRQQNVQQEHLNAEEYSQRKEMF